METRLSSLTTWKVEDSGGGECIRELSQRYGREIDKQAPASILVAEQGKGAFLAAFLAGVARGIPVFLANPSWRETEWRQVFEQTQPDLVFGEIQVYNQKREKEFPHPLVGEILVPTGGSGGRVRFARHSWTTLVRAAQAMCQFFETEIVNSCCVLPLYHVSGLMQAVRSFITGGELLLPRWPSIEAGEFPLIPLQEYFISLVPTQLKRLLAVSGGLDWLRCFRAVLLGGASVGKDLLDRARDLRIPLAPCYGMTETAGMVTALRVEEFREGLGSSGSVLRQVKISILGDEKEVLPSGETGRIGVQTPSLFSGYWGGQKHADFYTTDDEGWLDRSGHLHVKGRIDRTLITGGEKVDADEVEQALVQSGLVLEALVLGLPDKEWGQRVVAFYVPRNLDQCSKALKTLLRAHLSEYKIPKQLIPVSRLPIDEKGKPDWSQISV